MKYRSDIDGLRAIAVLGVLFFHLRIPFFSGGFTGVDIFFVISGYLITSILVKDIQANTFSFSGFYERRVRRIFPAYFCMLFLSFVLACLILVPKEMLDFSEAIQHSLVFISNFLFSQEVGYFDSSFDKSPLLHTWSLSVEEQFYLIWPVILLFLGRRLSTKMYIRTFVVSLCLFLVLSEILSHMSSNLAFYMLYSRVWELGAGAILALPFLPELKKRWHIRCIGYTGVVLLACSFFIIHDEIRFPGIVAIMPVLGSACIIYSGKFGNSSSIYSIFSFKPLVYIGLISYSLYLYHWPLIIFAEKFINRPLHIGEGLVIGLISIFLAFLSYHYVEKPFRIKAGNTSLGSAGEPLYLPNRKKLFQFSFALVFCCFLITVWIQQTNGLTIRFPGLNQNIFASNPLARDCNIKGFASTSMMRLNNECAINKGSRSAILWGDSHANHYAQALQKFAKNKDLSLYQKTKYGCPPVLGNVNHLTADGKYGENPACSDFNKQIVTLIEQEKIEVVVLASLWSPHFENYNVEKKEHLLEYSLPSKDSFPDPAMKFKQQVLAMIDHLLDSGVEVYVMGEVPIFNKSPPQCYYSEKTPLKRIVYPERSSAEMCSLSIQEALDTLESSVIFFNNLSRQDEKVSFFDPIPYFCNKDNTCSAIQGGQILYLDAGHLNLAGAKFLSPWIARDLN